jgi:hypothetical protein
VVTDRQIELLLKKKASVLNLSAANYCWFEDPAKALCLKLAGTRSAAEPLTGLCDSSRCPQATHHIVHRSVWQTTADNGAVLPASPWIPPLRKTGCGPSTSGTPRECTPPSTVVGVGGCPSRSATRSPRAGLLHLPPVEPGQAQHAGGGLAVWRGLAAQVRTAWSGAPKASATHQEAGSVAHALALVEAGAGVTLVPMEYTALVARPGTPPTAPAHRRRRDRRAPASGRGLARPAPLPAR